MSQAKAIPEGLKQSECERNLKYRPPIPYIPEKDVTAEAVTGQGSSCLFYTSDAADDLTCVQYGVVILYITYTITVEFSRHHTYPEQKTYL